MTDAHLTAEELDLLVIGDGLPVDRASHIAACLACRRRRDELLAAISGAVLADPELQTRSRVRAAALAAVPHRRSPVRWRLAAAAALILAAVAAVFVVTEPRRPPLDTEAILLEVDEVLARDPLAAMADESVLDVVVAGSAVERGAPSNS